MRPELAAATYLWADLIRYGVVAVGVGAMLIHVCDLYDAAAHAVPPRVRVGLVLRWTAHIALTGVLTMFIYSRLGEAWTWYSPVIAFGYALLAASTWLLRERDPIMEAAPAAKRKS